VRLQVKPSFEIIPAKPWPCGQIARLIRQDERRSLLALGDPHRQCADAMRDTLFPKAWLAASAIFLS